MTIIFHKRPYNSFIIWVLFLLIFSQSTSYAQNCAVNSGADETICANENLFLNGSKSGLFNGVGETMWTQVGGSTVTILEPESLTTEVTNFLGGNTYVFRLSTNCLDGSYIYQDVTKNVLAVSNANAGPDATYCPNESSFMAANTLLSGETGEWSGGGAGISVNNINSPLSSITMDPGSSGSATFTWTVTNTNGCSSSDQVVITNRGGQPISAGEDQTLSHCYSSTQSTQLNGSYAGTGIDGQIGLWGIISGPNIPNIQNQNQNNSLITNLIEGEYTFRWTVMGPCVSGYDEVTIFVPAPTADITSANAGSDQQFCDNTITTTVLSGNTPQFVNETVLWEQISGPEVTIVNPNSTVTQVTGLVSPNTYQFRYTINNVVTVCDDEDIIQLSYNPTPPTISIDVTGDQMFTGCDESFIAIPFTAGGSGTSEYRIISGPDTPGLIFPTDWNGTGSSPVTVTGLTAIGVYVIELRRNTGQGASCGSVYDQISVITSQRPTVSNAGTLLTLDCNINKATLIANDPDVGVGTWSQVSGPGNVTLLNTHCEELYIENLDNGLYTFQWLISGGPNCPEETDQVTVLVSDDTPTAVSAGDDQTICYGSPFFLDADPPTYIFELGTWSSTSGEVSFANENSPTTQVFGMLENTSYPFKWTIENGCGTASSVVLITTSDSQGPIASDAGADQCLESGTTSFTMSANDPSPGTGQWVQLTGPVTVTVTNSSLQTTTMSDAIDGIYTFEWQINSGECFPSRDTVMITISDPVTAADAGSDQIVCGYSATLSANNAIVGVGEWAQISGNAGVIIANTASATTEVSNLSPGVYNFTWTITNGSCSDSDTVKLFVSNEVPSIADAGVDFDVCGLSTITMSATAPVSGSGFWSFVSGPNTPVFTTPDSPISSVTGLITGTYIFRWTVTGGVYCPVSSDDVEVTVVRLADAGDDQSYCEAITSVQLTGTTASMGTWTQSGTMPAVATIITSSPNTAIASDLAASGVYTFKYTIAASGCASSDVMTVTLYTPPSIANAGVDMEYCDLETFTMSAETPVSGTGTWSKLSGPAAGSFTNANDPTTTFTGAVPGIYVFQWDVANYTCSNADQVRVTNYASPSTAMAGTDQDLNCLDYATMDANSPDVGLGTWTIESSPSGSTPSITSPILYNTEITNLLPDVYPGIYSFKWTISNGPVCATSSDVVNITVQESPTPAEAGPDQVLCDAVSTTLAATPVTTGTGTWIVVNKPATALDPTFDNIAAPEAVVSLLSYGTYELKWKTTTSFCTSSDVMLIENNEPPTTANASATASDVCHYQPLVLVGNAPTAGTGVWSQIAGDPVVILSPNSPTTSVVGEDVGTYQFKWSITNGSACATSSDVVSVTVNEIPTQALAGPDQILCQTTTTTLDGNFANTASGVTGTWTIESKPSGAPDPFFSSSTDSDAILSGLQVGSPAEYEFRWTHSTGGGTCETYDIMKVIIWEEPSDALAGDDQTLCDESSVTMTATSVTVGSGLWSRVSGPNTPIITDASSATTTITGLTNGTYVFRWTTSNGVCTDKTDEVIIQNNEVISGGPESITICSGGAPTIEANASGGDGTYTYQWQVSDTDCAGTWSDIYGATSSSYTTPALTATSHYRVLIDDGICATYTSPCATISVVADPIILSNPNNAEICRGGTAEFSITASGGTPERIYQWERSDDGIVSWANVGTNNISHNSNSGLGVDDYFYRVTVSSTGIGCDATTSSSAVLNIVADPVISTDLADVTICSGSSHTFDIDVTGGTGDFTYSWEDSPNGSNSWNSVGTDSDVYSTINLNTTRYFRVGITQSGSGCDALNSNAAQVEVPRITSQPTLTNNEICIGGSTTVSADAVSGNATLLWSWEYSTTESGTYNPVVDGTPAGAVYSDEDTKDLSISGITVGGSHFYQARITVSDVNAFVGANCDDLVSDASELYVVPDPEITTQPIGGTICENGTFTMSVVAFGGSPSLEYQWQYHNGTTWVNAPGVGNASLYITEALSQDTLFRVLISAVGSGCDPITSSSSMVIVNNLTPGIIGYDEVICENETATPFTSVSSAMVDGVLSYQWEVSTTNATTGFTEISGATLSTYTEPAALTVDTWYRRKATSLLNGQECHKYSNVIKITVNPTPVADQPADQVLCNNTATAAVNFSGSVGGTVFNWTNTNSSIGLGVSGSGNIPSFTATNTGNTVVQATITVSPQTNSGTLCTGSDVIFTYTVNPTPDVDAITDQILCNGANTTQVSFTGAVSGTIYRWTNDTPSVGLAASGDGNINTFEAINNGTSPVTATIVVTPEYSNAGLTCYGSSKTLTITVNPTPLFTSTLTPPSICDNEQFSYTPETNVTGVSPVSYAWVRATVAGISPVGTTGTGNPNETLDNTTNFDQSVTYSYSVTAGGCSSVATSDVVVRVNPTPNLSFTNATICSGLSPNVVLNTSDTETTFYYDAPAISNASGDITGGNARPEPGDRNAITDVLTNITAGIRTATYTVVPIIDGCTGPSGDVVVTVNPVPIISADQDDRLCTNASYQATSDLDILTDPSMPTALFTYNAPVLTAGLTGGQARGTASSANITDLFTNSTNIIQTATYTITPKASSALGGCTGDSETAIIYVLPRPEITSPLTASSCEGPYNYTITGNVSGSTFGWTRAEVAGITPPTASGTTSSITETLSNNSALPIDIEYVLTPTGPDSDNCDGTPSTLTVTVYPDPTIDTQPADITICSNSSTTLSVVASGGFPSLDYQWEISAN